MNEDEPDPRALVDGICGAIDQGPLGIEWICVKPEHNPEYLRKSTDPRHVGYVRGTGAHPERPIGVQAPPADRHHFVNRWPNRKINYG